jgi:hypothetical protein
MNIFDNERLKILSAAVCEAANWGADVERALEFALAGFTAPAYGGAPLRK